MSTVPPVPPGFNTLSAYIIVEDSVKALEFYARAFGAEPGDRMTGPGGKGTLHAEMRLGDSTFMLSDANPQWGLRSARQIGGSPVGLHIYVENADALFERAVKAGCEVRYPLEDTFWGDRFAKVVDPFGIEWGIATHKEDLTPEQISERAAAWFAKFGGEGGCEGGD